MTRHPDNRDAELATLRAYLREIGKLSRLTTEQEQSLARRIQQEHDEEALRALVEANLRFVVAYAKRYQGLGVPFLDLVHEGNLGLMEAARRFDPSRHVKFITYAVWWVRQSIVHALSSQSRTISLPPKLSPIAAKFGKQVAALSVSLDRAPTLGEIADDLDISVAEADALLYVGRGEVSLDGPSGDNEGRSLEETLARSNEPSPDDTLAREAMVSQVRDALGDLDPKEREVMALRFGLAGGEPLTLQQIGDRLRVSRERVRQIEARAKNKLRRSRKAGVLRNCLN